MTYRFITIFMASAIILSACASSPKPRQGGQQDTHSGAMMATPMSLALTGLASDLDGAITVSDVGKAAGEQFERFDVDASGRWSAIEHSRWANAILGDAYGRPTLRMLDRDSNGAASKTEFMTFMVEAARRADTDSNGRVERSELLIQMPEGRRGRQGGQGRDSGRDQSRQGPPRVR